MLQSEPVAHAHMLIRKPVSEVFEAFVDPQITSKFWFSRGDRRLDEGASVKWYWDMYGVHADVTVKALETNKRILIAWPTPVEWTFEPRETAPLFKHRRRRFRGHRRGKGGASDRCDGRLYHGARGCKAYLEHGIELNLVADHNPDHHVSRS